MSNLSYKDSEQYKSRSTNANVLLVILAIICSVVSVQTQLANIYYKQEQKILVADTLQKSITIDSLENIIENTPTTFDTVEELESYIQ